MTTAKTKRRCAWILIFALIMIVALLLFFVIRKNGEALSQTDEIRKYRNTMLALLNDSITEALEQHYGRDSIPEIALYDASVKIEPKNGWANSYVTVEVTSFYGPHGPPFATERMVFDIGLGKIKLVSYARIPQSYQTQSE